MSEDDNFVSIGDAALSVLEKLVKGKWILRRM